MRAEIGLGHRATGDAHRAPPAVDEREVRQPRAGEDEQCCEGSPAEPAAVAGWAWRGTGDRIGNRVCHEWVSRSGAVEPVRVR